MLEAIANAVGSLVGAGVNWLRADKDEDTQQKFARNAIQWKVEDAKKAGVHPLYALGAPTMSFSPSTAPVGELLAQGGQDISRAIGAGMPKAGQVSAYEAALQKLNLEGGSLDNEMKRTQLARLRNEMLMKPALPNPMLMPGGEKFQPGPQVPAQRVQDQYGDVIESAYGIPSVIYDSFTNLDKMMGGNFLGKPGYIMNGRPTSRPRGRQGPRHPSYNYSKTGRR